MRRARDFQHVRGKIDSERFEVTARRFLEFAQKKPCPHAHVKNLECSVRVQQSRLSHLLNPEIQGASDHSLGVEIVVGGHDVIVRSVNCRCAHLGNP